MIFYSASASNIRGVLVVDQYGLPIESSGGLNVSQSGIVSSIMKNVAQLSQTLSLYKRYLNDSFPVLPMTNITFS